MKTTTPIYRKRTQRDYSLGFKLAVVEAVEKGELTYKQAQQKYGIQGRSTALVWLRKHGKLDWSSQGGQVMSRKPETPEQKIKRLEQELRDAKDLNYLQHEMLKEVDRLCGTRLEKSIYPNGKKGAGRTTTEPVTLLPFVRLYTTSGVSTVTALP